MGVTKAESSITRLGSCLVDKFEHGEVVSVPGLAAAVAMSERRITNPLQIHFRGVVSRRAGKVILQSGVTAADLKDAIEAVNHRPTRHAWTGNKDPHFNS